MLQDMFGDEAVPKVFKGDKFVVTVDGKKANIDLTALVGYILILCFQIAYFFQSEGSGMF